MKKSYLLWVLLILSHTCISQIIEFEDQELKTVLLSADETNGIASSLDGYQMKIDANDDGEISLSEALEVGSLDVSNSNISSIVDINNFLSLNYLYCLGNPNLNSVELVSLGGLKTLFLPSLTLDSIIFKNCTSLEFININEDAFAGVEHIEMENCPKLSSLNFGQYSGTSLSLKGLHDLEYLKLASGIINLELSDVAQLEFLNLQLYYNQSDFDTIKIENAPSLESLEFNKVEFLSLLNVNSDNVKVHSGCHNVNIENCSNLNTVNLSFEESSVHTLSLSNLPLLKKIIVDSYNNEFMSSIHDCNNIQEMRLGGLDNNNLDLSIYPDFNLLYLYNSTIDSVLFENNDSLYSVYLSDSNVSSMQIESSNDFQILNINYSEIDEIELNDLPSFNTVKIFNSAIPSLDLHDFSSLHEIDINGNNNAGFNIVLPEDGALSILLLNSVEIIDADLSQLHELAQCRLDNILTLETVIFPSTSNNLSIELLGDTQLVSCDVSAANSIYYFNLKGSKIESLDLTGNSNLLSLYLMNNDLLNNINLTNCSSLGTFHLSNTGLSDLNLSGCTNLNTVNVENNALTNLDLTGCTNLNTVNVENNALTNLDLSGATQLTSLACHENNLTTLNISNNTILNTLDCSNNELVSLDLTSSNELINLNASSNNLANININNCSNLLICDVSHNELLSFDVGNVVNLKELYLDYNGLTEINIDNLPNLLQLSLTDNDFSEFSLENVPLLANLSLTNNSISDLSLINLPHLSGLTIYGNPMDTLYIDNILTFPGYGLSAHHLTLKNLNFSQNSFSLSGTDNLSYAYLENLTGFTILNCNNHSNLKHIDIINCSDITNINLVNNDLETYNLVGLSNLSYLDLSKNRLYDYDISQFPSLEHLVAKGNRITNLSFAVSNNLKFLELGESELLTTVDLTNCTQLDEFKCSSSHLEDIIAAPTNVIKTMYLSYNKIDSLNLDRFPKLDELSIYNSPINELILADHDFLNSLTVRQTQLTDLEITNCSELEALDFEDNEVLVSLDIDQVERLKTIESTEGILTSVTINNCDSITLLNFIDNQLSEIDVANLAQLENLVLSFNFLTDVNLSGLPNLKDLDLSYNPITDIDLDGLISLENLSLVKSNISNFELENNNSLIHLYLTSDSLENFSIESCSALKETYLNVTGFICPALKTASIIDCSEIQSINVNYSYNLDSVFIKDCNSMQTLSLNNNSISSFTLINSNNVSHLNLSHNHLDTFNLDGLAGLTNLKLAYNNLSNIDITNLTNLSILDVGSNNLNNLNLTTTPNLTSLTCKSNQISDLDLSNLTSLNELYCQSNLLTSLDLSNLTSLDKLNCQSNLLTSLDLSNLTSLNELNCQLNLLTSLDLSGLITLDEAYVGNNELTNLLFGNNQQLNILECYHNQLTSLDLSGLINLNVVRCYYNNIDNILFGINPHLHEIYCNKNNLANIDVSGLSYLEQLNCSNNIIENIDVTSLYNLETVNCSNNLLETIDFSYAPDFFSFDVDSNLLTTMYIRNEAPNYSLSFDGNPDLQYICMDDIDEYYIQSKLDSYGMTDVIFNSNCPAAPGIFHSLFRGHTILDQDNDGCDDSDLTVPFGHLSEIAISGNGFFSTYYSNQMGFTQAYLLEGTYQSNVVVNYDDYLSINPMSTNFTFVSEPDTLIQDYCVSIDEPFHDVETFFYVDVLRAGFNSTATLYIQNKGVIPVSGEINFTFDDDVLEYFSSSVPYDAISEGLLTWNYADLQPFELRKITIVFDTNLPTDPDFPLLIDDVYSFASNVTPLADDADIQNNYFYIKKKVVGSYDPNDKTCLQGNQLNPDMVGDFLTYMIRFENTGTYPASRIVVVDLIDENVFDISTLEPLVGSHPFSTKVTNNRVEFIFDDIQLGFEDDENDGWVMFKIKTLPTLSLGDEIKNTAEIYFDFNPPIITNEETTIIENDILIKTDDPNELVFSFAPNMVSNIIHFESNQTLLNIEIKAMTGQKVLKPDVSEDDIFIENLASGMYILSVTTSHETRGFKFYKL